MKSFSRFFIFSSAIFVSLVCIATFLRWQFDLVSFNWFTFYFGNINPTVAIGLIINAVLLILLHYIVKPVSFIDFINTIKQLSSYWLTLNRVVD